MQNGVVFGWVFGVVYGVVYGVVLANTHPRRTTSI